MHSDNQSTNPGSPIDDRDDRRKARARPVGNPNGSVWLALLIGISGGALFSLLKLPLAWMLGAMVFTTIASIAGVRIRLPHIPRMAMIAILGVMLGSAFSPELLDRLGQWAVSIAGLLVYALTAGALVFYYFLKAGKYDPVTAYFSSSPGGLNEMVIVGREMGGDDRVIALSHACRVLLTVMLIPFLFRIFGDYTPPDGILPRGSSFTELALQDWLILGACAVIGPIIANFLRLPAAFLTGAMIVSAIVHMLGWSSATPPSALIAIAQVVLGTGVGCRFTGTTLKEVTRVLRLSIGSTALLLSAAVAAGLILEGITGVPWFVMVLAYAPGGLAEMSLVALGIGQDIAFVATHHIFRIAIIVILAPIFFRVIRGRGL